MADYSEFPLPQSVPLFCLPFGVLVEAWERHAMFPLPIFSTFALTSAVGQCVCYSLYAFLFNFLFIRFRFLAFYCCPFISLIFFSFLPAFVFVSFYFSLATCTCTLYLSLVPSLLIFFLLLFIPCFLCCFFSLVLFNFFPYFSFITNLFLSCVFRCMVLVWCSMKRFQTHFLLYPV